jgi:hypothetical protein
MTQRRYDLESRAAGGRVHGAVSYTAPTDQILKIMAHTKLARACQLADPAALTMRCIQHYGWEKIKTAGNTRVPPGVGAGADVERERDEEDEDNKFVATCSLEDKCEWALVYIAENGMPGFFSSCYDRAHEGELNTGKNKFLVDVYYALRNLEDIPGFMEAADVVALLDKKTLNGVGLFALSKCRSAKDVMRSDAARRNEQGTKMKDPFLEVGIGSRLECVTQLASVIGVPSLFAKCSLPNRIVELAKRDRLKLMTQVDTALLSELKNAFEVCVRGVMGHSSGKHSTVVELLRGIYASCAMMLATKTKKDSQPPRSNTITEIVVTPLPVQLFADYWLVYSPRLGRKVRVSEWENEHDAFDEENARLGIDDDDDLDEALSGAAADGVAGGGATRTEYYVGSAVQNELARLLAQQPRTQRDQRWLLWLQRLVKDAHDAGGDRLALTVTYTKMYPIGRRVACYPSCQTCPSELRKLVFIGEQLDIVNCHPTLMLQVVKKMQAGRADRVPTLAQVVNDRETLLKDVGDHYGVSRALAKSLVLCVLNGGSVANWASDNHVAVDAKDKQPDICALRGEYRIIREALFHKFPEHVDSLRARFQSIRNGKVASTKAQLDGASQGEKEAAKKACDKARVKALPESLDRSIFSYCMFELEDSVINAIDTYFCEHGWEVPSLVYDALYVAPRDDGADIKAAVRGAEAAVRQKLGYDVQLSLK